MSDKVRNELPNFENIKKGCIFPFSDLLYTETIKTFENSIKEKLLSSSLDLLYIDNVVCSRNSTDEIFTEFIDSLKFVDVKFMKTVNVLNNVESFPYSIPTEEKYTPKKEAYLKPNDKGSKVKILQRDLKAIGYYPDKVKGEDTAGSYAAATEATVFNFQKAEKDSLQFIDGKVYLETLSKITEKLIENHHAFKYVKGIKPQAFDKVKDIQRKLKALGYYNYSEDYIDGEYGEKSKKAVEELQKDHMAGYKEFYEACSRVGVLDETTIIVVNYKYSELVKELQINLETMGYTINENEKSEGIYGTTTVAAIKAFQGLKMDRNENAEGYGVLDKETVDAINKAPGSSAEITAEYAKVLLAEAKDYVGEKYDANVSTSVKPQVQLKQWDNPNKEGASLTLWKTSSQVCTDGSGTIQSPTHYSSTAMGPKINAEVIPYIVQPLNNNNDVMLGDLGIVVDTVTNKSVYVIYAERGPKGKIGEMSIATFEKLGLSYKTGDKFHGYNDLRFITIMFPGSGAAFGYKYNSIPKDAAEIERNAKKWFKGFMGQDTSGSEGDQSSKNLIIQQILQRAKAMIDYTWTPKQTLYGWRGEDKFTANEPVQGIPYSMTEYQTDLARFQEALKREDFYVSGYKREDKYPDKAATMPKYGNDCSGFVSFAWNMDRMTTYGIQKSAYTRHFSIGEKALKPGDAFVKDTHTMLYVATDENGDYICYEQTPPKAVVKTHTRQSLIDSNYVVYRLLSLMD